MPAAARSPPGAMRLPTSLASRGLALLVADIVDETFDAFDDDRQVGFTGRDDPEITDVINIGESRFLLAG